MCAITACLLLLLLVFSFCRKHPKLASESSTSSAGTRIVNIVKASSKLRNRRSLRLSMPLRPPSSQSRCWGFCEERGICLSGGPGLDFGWLLIVTRGSVCCCCEERACLGPETDIKPRPNFFTLMCMFGCIADSHPPLSPSLIPVFMSPAIENAVSHCPTMQFREPH